MTCFSSFAAIVASLAKRRMLLEWQPGVGDDVSATHLAVGTALHRLPRYIPSLEIDIDHSVFMKYSGNYRSPSLPM